MYDYGWRMYMPDIGRWNGIDQLAESYGSYSPYAYVMNNPISYYDPDGRYSSNWLQDMWDKTTSYSIWTNNGNGSFRGGEVDGGITPENFTSFYNFLAGGGTGRFTYWTGGAMPSTTYTTIGGYDYKNIQGLVGHSIDIKAWGTDVFRGVGNGAIGLAEDSFGVFGMAAKWALGREDLFSRLSVKYKSAELIGVIGFALVEPSPGGEISAAGKVFTKVYRAVDNVELSSINRTGKFLIKEGGTEAKYFADTFENANKFGKQLYPDGYTVVEGIIYNSNNPMKYWSANTDGIGAFIFNQKALKAVKPIKTP